MAQDLKIDGVQNLLQLTALSSQYGKAAKNAKLLSAAIDLPLSFTGHSLGGGLAALASLVSGNKATTFNSASLSDRTMKKYGVLHNSQKNILAVAMRFDPLTILQDGMPGINSSQGTRLTLKSPFLHKPLDYHSINTVIEYFEFYK